MYKWLAICLLVLIVFPASGDEFDPSGWQYYKDVRALTGASSQYGRTTLDREVYSHAKADLGDLRMVDRRGRLVEYALIAYDGSSQAKKLDASVLTRESESNTTILVLDLGRPGIRSNRVVINTKNDGYRARVKIEGSDDREQWSTLRNDGFIFAASGDPEARLATVNYPSSDSRYIRVSIDALNQLSQSGVWHTFTLDISGADIFDVTPMARKQTLLFEGEGKVTQNADVRTTDVILDMETQGYPGFRLVIESPDAHFLGRVVVSGSEDGKSWKDLGTGAIARYTSDEFEVEHTSIEYPEARHRYIRLHIVNEIEPLINVSKVQVYGIRRALFFEHGPRRDYRLYYGNPDASKPEYPFAKRFASVQSKAAVVLHLGQELVNSGEAANGVRSDPWYVVLGLVVLGMIAVYFLRRALRSKQRPK